MGSIAEVDISPVEEKHTVAKFDLLKSKFKTLSPKIFSKAKPTKGSNTMAGHRLYVFENLLSAVVQAYYKSSYSIETMCLEIKPEAAEIGGVQNKKIKDKRRKTIHKFHKTEPRSEARHKKVAKEEVDDQNFTDSRGLLDYLVSPLKVDYEFGQLIRELVG